MHSTFLFHEWMQGKVSHTTHFAASICAVISSATCCSTRMVTSADALVIREAGYTALPHCGWRTTLQQPAFMVLYRRNVTSASTSPYT